MIQNGFLNRQSIDFNQNMKCTKQGDIILLHPRPSIDKRTNYNSIYYFYLPVFIFLFYFLDWHGQLIKPVNFLNKPHIVFSIIKLQCDLYIGVDDITKLFHNMSQDNYFFVIKYKIKEANNRANVIRNIQCFKFSRYSRSI